MKETGLVNEPLATSMEEEAMRIPENSLDKYRQGATFVSYTDMATIHLAQTHYDYDPGLIEVIKSVNDVDVKEDRPTRRFDNNTTFAMVELQGGYSGVGSISVSIMGNWYKTSYLLSKHQNNSL